MEVPAPPCWVRVSCRSMAKSDGDVERVSKVPSTLEMYPVALFTVFSETRLRGDIRAAGAATANGGFLGLRRVSGAA